jgi:hypothetical protein
MSNNQSRRWCAILIEMRHKHVRHSTNSLVRPCPFNSRKHRSLKFRTFDLFEFRFSIHTHPFNMLKLTKSKSSLVRLTICPCSIYFRKLYAKEILTSASNSDSYLLKKIVYYKTPGCSEEYIEATST